MSRPPDVSHPVETIDQADLVGWQFLSVYCGCRITWLDWQKLRRSTRYRRLDEIVPRLRCSDCGRAVKTAELYWQGGRNNDEQREKKIL